MFRNVVFAEKGVVVKIKGAINTNSAANDSVEEFWKIVVVVMDQLQNIAKF